MIRSQLNSYSGADPIWGFVALIGSERYTGEAAVGIDPRVRLFAVDGRVYFAEREGDAPIGTRLVNCGAVSTTQLEAGVVQIGETTSLARLFQRQPSIDRDAVELTIELATESLLDSIANKAVGMPEVFPLRHHSSGVHHWLRAGAAPAPLPVVEVPAVAAPVEPTLVVAGFDAAASTVDLRFIEEAVVEEAITEEAVVEEAVTEQAAIEEPAIDEPVVEEAIVEETVVEEPIVEEAIVEETVVEEPRVEEAIVEEPVVEEAVIDEAAIVEEPVVEEAVIDEAVIDEPVTEEAAIDEPVIEEAIVEEAVIDEPIVTGLVAAPAAPLALPTLGSFAAPAAAESHIEEGHGEELHVEDFQDVEVAEEGHAAGVGVNVEESVADAAPVDQPMLAPTLAPMPTLASLTLPISQSASAPLPLPAPDNLVATEPTTASTADVFFASLPEQPTFAPVNPYVLAEPPAALPKLTSAPISTSGLPAANPTPATAFGEPTHNLAAVDIWEMVDVLTDDRQHHEQELVGSGASEKRGRSWLRSKKG